jgi:SAM-dependent methyltransferase
MSEWEFFQGAKILDYGCGTMPYCSVFALAGAESVGADIGPNKNAQIRISDAGGLPLIDGSFDYVVSFQVLEHVPIPHDYLAEANRVLKPCGKLFLTTHGLWPYHPTPGDYHRWTRDGLTYQLSRAGFDLCSAHCILNEYSAALQFFVMNADYRGKWGPYRKLVHLLTHLVIRFLERHSRQMSQLPAVLCVLAVKR